MDPGAPQDATGIHEPGRARALDLLSQVAEHIASHDGGVHLVVFVGRTEGTATVLATPCDLDQLIGRIELSKMKLMHQAFERVSA